MRDPPQTRVAGALLERGRELGQLTRRLDDACAGVGGIALVEGPAGIGKTRLLEAVRAAAGERAMTVLVARASELDREFPFGVVRQLFEPLLARAGDEERARLLTGAASLATRIFGGPDAHDAPAPSDQSLMLFHALYWLTANVAERAPAFVVVDDVHWADPSSLRFLQFLLPRLPELSVLVALGVRSGEPAADREALDALASDALADVVRPAPLSPEAVGALVDDAFGASADRSFRDACHEATSGNPLLVRELLRELSADGIAPDADSALLVRQLAPSTVARAVLLRLARLGEDASKLARAVAVLGDAVPLRRACALADVAQDDGEELAARLAQADIFAAQRPLGFAHPILRAAVYAELDPGERPRAHRRAAELLEAEGAEVDAVAVHLLATGPRGDPKVVRTLREAARWALSRGATQTALACLRRAVDEPPSAEERARVVLELASAELRAGDAAAASDHFAEATASSDARLRARFAWDHALALQALGRHEEAFRIRERAVDAVRGVDAELALSLEATLIASARLELPRLAWARARLEHHLAQPSLPARPRQRMRVTHAYIRAFARDSGESAAELAAVAEDALDSGDLLDGTIGLTTPFFSAIELLLLADRPERARRALDRLVEQSQRRGSAPGFAFASGWRCLLFLRAGALAEAEADARNCAELALAQGWFRLSPLILGYGLEALIERGELDDAQALLERSGMAAQVAGDDLLLDPVVHARARLRAATGDLAGAARDLASLERHDARWNTYPALVPGVLVAPELAAADPDAARARAERMLREAHVWGTPRAIGVALRANALVAGGARRIELLEQAVAVLERSPARLEHARALADLGAALRAANRRAAARERLRSALDAAAAAGALALAERVRHELRAAGGRPRRERISGVESLTASERRIATMAAEGRSNPEIAQALFVTKKTVEAHLANVYRKLDIRSRTQLAGALRD